MRPEELELLSICIRNILITGSSIGVLIFFLTHILRRKQNLWIPIIYYVIHVLLRNILCGYILPFYFADKIWVSVVQLAVNLLTNAICWFMWYYTMEGEFIRIGILAILSEIFATMLNFICLAILNLLEQRPPMEIGEFMWLDVLLPIMEGACAITLWHFFKRWLIKLRTSKLLVPWIFWIVFFAFNGMAVYSAIWSSVSNWEELAAFLLIIYMVCFGLLIRFAITQSKRTRGAQAYLDAQKRVLETHYDVMQSQVQHVEEQQKLIDEQMSTIVGMDAVVDSETMQAYLAQLKESYAGIRVGIYCDDWTIDAMLYLQKKAYEEQGIGFECFLQEYDRGSIEERDILQIILSLLEFGRNGKWISLHMAGVKNQLLIQFEAEDVSAKQLPSKVFKTIVQKYHGELEVQDKNATLHVVMMLEKE